MGGFIKDTPENVVSQVAEGKYDYGHAQLLLENPDVFNQVLKNVGLSANQYAFAFNPSEAASGSGLYMAGLITNAVGLGVSVGEYSNVVGGMWRGANGSWYGMGWGGNQYSGARAEAVGRAGVFANIGRALFLVGAGISTSEVFNSLAKGDMFGVTKSLVDIGAGAVGTFGGLGGFAVGTAYFGFDLMGGLNPSAGMASPVPFAAPDATKVGP